MNGIIGVCAKWSAGSAEPSQIKGMKWLFTAFCQRWQDRESIICGEWPWQYKLGIGLFSPLNKHWIVYSDHPINWDGVKSNKLLNSSLSHLLLIWVPSCEAHLTQTSNKMQKPQDCINVVLPHCLSPIGGTASKRWTSQSCFIHRWAVLWFWCSEGFVCLTSTLWRRTKLTQLNWFSFIVCAQCY